MLTKPTIYLAGGMEKAGERGWQWRKDITPHLNNLGYEVWNPYTEELNVGIDVDGLKRLKETSYQEYLSFCRKIVDFDISALIKCAAVAVLIDESVLAGAGTYGELTVCRHYKVPVYAWIDLPNGKYDVPSWAMGCIDHYSFNEVDFYASITSCHDKK